MEVSMFNETLFNEAELLTRVCEILDKNGGVFAQAAEQNVQILQVEGMALDFAARRVHVEGLHIDFETDDVQAWEKSIYMSAAEYETFSKLAARLGVAVDHKGLLVRISGDHLDIPILLYVSPTAG